MKSNHEYTDVLPVVKSRQIKVSDWTCHLFGMGPDGIVLTPEQGHVPNWFWRKMQYLCFGHKWIRTEPGREE